MPFKNYFFAMILWDSNAEPCWFSELGDLSVSLKNWTLRGDLASLLAQKVKNPPAMQETWIQFLEWQDPLEEGMATHSSILAWRVPMDRGAWWATVPGVAKSLTWLSD